MVNTPARWFSNARSRLRDILQTLLERRGMALVRISPHTGVPPSLVQYLHELCKWRESVEAVIGFDDDPYIQKDFLKVFSANQVKFFSRPSAGSDPIGFPPAAAIEKPVERFLVELDGETLGLPQMAAEFPWLTNAEVILVRSTLGYFWSGNGDLLQLVEFMKQRGFAFYDTLEYFKLHLLNGSMGRLVLVFEKQKSKPNDVVANRKQNSAVNVARIARINEALAFLSNPIAQASKLVRLAGRGSYGFAAGVLNPGAITNKEGVVLLARGEHIPWSLSKHNLGDFLHGCQPVQLELDDRLSVIGMHKLALSNAKATEGTRLEDFRLFRFGDQLFANHVQAVPTGDLPSKYNPIQAENIRFRVGISQVDVDKNELKFLGLPSLDILLKSSEKNWVCFEHNKELFLIYSFNPYHLLRARHWPQLDFTTVIRHAVVLPVEADKITFRNSVNPVEYDRQYFLHVVHKVYPGKQYAYWAVLIDKDSLLPKKISARPLICGWKSASAAIIYVCSVVPRQDEILIFGGLNDSSMGCWRVSRTALDENWSPWLREDTEKSTVA